MTTKPKTLIVWMNVPDNVKAYVVNSDSAEGLLAAQCAGKFINSDEDFPTDHPIYALMDKLADLPYTDEQTVILDTVHMIVFCGFFM